MDPETQRLLNLLQIILKILGLTHREIARRLEMSSSYLSKLLSGMSEIRLDHVVRICRAIGLEPWELFSFAYPRQAEATPTAARLRELLQQSPPPPPPANEALDKERVQQMVKEMLEKAIGRNAGS